MKIVEWKIYSTYLATGKSHLQQVGFTRVLQTYMYIGTVYQF